MFRMDITEGSSASDYALDRRTPRIINYNGSGLTWSTGRIEQVIGRAILRSESHQTIISKTFIPTNFIDPINLETLTPDELTNMECAICLGENTIQPNKTWCQISCEHKFHSCCITQWLEQKKSCPTCRSELTPFENSDTETIRIKESIEQLEPDKKKIFFDLITQSYSHINVEGFEDLRLNFSLIYWFLETYINNKPNKSSQLKLSYLNYLFGKNKGIFNVFARPTKSQQIHLNFEEIVYSIDLDQARCIRWFLADPVMFDELINAHQLFLLPQIIV